MAKLLLATMILVACCILLSSQVADATAAPAFEASAAFKAAVRKYSPINCAAKCDYRCSKASLHKRCLKYCNICCSKCNCVPPGTAGNREVCPCYNQLMNTKHGHKCP